MLVSGTLMFPALAHLSNSYTCLKSQKTHTFRRFVGSQLSRHRAHLIFTSDQTTLPVQAMFTVFVPFSEMLNQYLPYLLLICGLTDGANGPHFSARPWIRAPCHVAVRGLLLKRWGLFLRGSKGFALNQGACACVAPLGSSDTDESGRDPRMGGKGDPELCPGSVGAG